MNERSRWSNQPQQRQNWSGQQGGWHDEPDANSARRGDWDGGQWRGSRDWGDVSSQSRQWEDRSSGERAGSDHGAFRRTGDYGPRESRWEAPSGRGDEAQRGSGAWTGDYGDSARRDDPFRAGSQSFAAGYGMRDGPDYDRYAGPSTGWPVAGSSRPTFGRGYGPDYAGSGADRTDRGLIERVSDTIAGWFGNDEDDSRRGRHQPEADRWGESHRGRGPGDYRRSDERIREDVNDRLTDDHRLDARRISVRVAEGEVTLDGSVPNRASKRRAEDLADAISGVKHVQNNLRIDAPGDALSSAAPSSSAVSGKLG